MLTKMEPSSAKSVRSLKTRPGRLCTQPLPLRYHRNSTTIQQNIQVPVAKSEVSPARTTTHVIFGDMADMSPLPGNGPVDDYKPLHGKLVYDPALRELVSHKVLA